MRKVTVFMKDGPGVTRLRFDVEAATTTTDEHGNLFLHHGANLIAVVSPQHFMALTCGEISDAD